MALRVGMLIVLSGLPALGLAKASSYDCVETGNTNIGWSGRAGQYTAEASTRIAKPGLVKISGLDTEKPFLMGQSVTRLLRVSTNGETIWMVERAPAGTMVAWTFFFKPTKEGPPTAVLVSTKSYDLLGPASFTTLYACEPNNPLSQSQ